MADARPTGFCGPAAPLLAPALNVHRPVTDGLEPPARKRVWRGSRRGPAFCPMNNPFRRLEDIQRDLGEVAIEITRTRFFHFTAPSGWAPAINAFRCGEQFIICVDLAGVERADLEVRAEPQRLTVRGTRKIAEPSCDEAPAIQVLALEIDHGPFERVLDLPVEIEAAQVTAEQRNGLLWIRLPLATHG